MRLFAIAAVTLVAASAASADTAQADRCAATLGTEPRVIYDASVASVQPSTDLRSLLTDKTRGLVQAGTVARSSARESARAAYKCLALKQKTD
jgi:hypothetical protein